MEPSEWGVEGIERMRLIRDDITARVQALLAELDIPLLERLSPYDH